MSQFYLAAIAIVTGGTLFLIGVYGFMGVPLETNRFLTILLEPLGMSPEIDRLYYGFLAFLGFWLTLCLWVRASASVALALVLGKVIMVGGALQVGILLPVALTINLYLLLYRMISNREP